MIVYRVQRLEFEEPFTLNRMFPGGRFSQAGDPVIYTSITSSLALLENLAHMPPDSADDYMAWEINIPEELNGLTLTFESLQEANEEWNISDEGYQLTQTIGSKLLQKYDYIIVPSVINQYESNVIISGREKVINKIKTNKLGPLAIDKRIRK